MCEIDYFYGAEWFDTFFGANSLKSIGFMWKNDISIYIFFWSRVQFYWFSMIFQRFWVVACRHPIELKSLRTIGFMCKIDIANFWYIWNQFHILLFVVDISKICGWRVPSSHWTCFIEKHRPAPGSPSPPAPRPRPGPPRASPTRPKPRPGPTRPRRSRASTAKAQPGQQNHSKQLVLHAIAHIKFDVVFTVGSVFICFCW